MIEFVEMAAGGGGLFQKWPELPRALPRCQLGHAARCQTVHSSRLPSDHGTNTHISSTDSEVCCFHKLLLTARGWPGCHVWKSPPCPPSRRGEGTASLGPSTASSYLSTNDELLAAKREPLTSATEGQASVWGQSAAPHPERWCAVSPLWAGRGLRG